MDRDFGSDPLQGIPKLRLRTGRFVSLFVFAVSVHAQAVRVHDGEKLTLHGRIAVEAVMRSQQITLKTEKAYIPVMNSSSELHDGNVTSEIQLSVSYRDFYPYRGRTVTVQGTMQTDEVSGYFLNGTRFTPTSVLDPDGNELLPKETSSRKVMVVGRSYSGMAKLPADPAALWQYAATQHGMALPGAGNFNCASNAPGDVVNCFCADGFVATQPESVVHGKIIPGQTFDDTDFAQFSAVADEGHRLQPAVKIRVECVRETVHKAGK